MCYVDPTSLSPTEKNKERKEKEKEKAPRYYVYQMLITENVDYPERKVGDIEEEMTEERAEKIQSLRDFLTTYFGDERFRDLLFDNGDEEAISDDKTAENS